MATPIACSQYTTQQTEWKLATQEWEEAGNDFSDSWNAVTDLRGGDAAASFGAGVGDTLGALADSVITGYHWVISRLNGGNAETCD